MTSDWPQVTIEEITTTLGDGLHSTPTYSKNGDYYFINSNNLCDGRITFDHKTKRCDAEAYEKHQKPIGNRTILVSINGTLGNVAYYYDEKVILGKSACYFNLKEGIEKRFIGYIVSSPIFQKYLEQIATGTTIKNVSLKSMREFSFKLPPLNIQRAVASVLGALDDKIENNQRMNETLEDMARVIFKSWFVDFDPVHAKAAGNAPMHMDAETAALFPSSFGNDGLPVGWDNKTLGEFIEIQNGNAFKSKDWTDEGIPFVKIGSVKPSIVDLSNCSFVSAEVAEQKLNFQLGVGDILIGLTGYVGEVGRVPLADKMPMLNQRVGRAVFKRESFEPFVYAAMRLPEFKSFAENQSHGSAQANVSTKQLQEYPVVVADILLIQKFNALLESYFDKILTNSAENQTLAELRDTLLPKLMSGEIRVKDAEREVEAAV